MKKLLLLLCCCSIHLSVLSQGYSKGDAIAGISIGAPHLYKQLEILNSRTVAFRSGFNGTVQAISVTGTNPIALKYEYALSDKFGLGLSVAWWTINVDVKNHQPDNRGYIHEVDYNYKLTSFSLGVRPNYHIKLDYGKGDLYVGCALGITRNAISATATEPNNPLYGYFERSYPLRLYVAPTIGYRFYLNNSFGLNAEFGFEKGALLQAGIVFRFRPYKYERPK